MVIEERNYLNLGTDKDNFSELYIQNNLTMFIKYINTKVLYTLGRHLRSRVCLSKIQANGLQVKRSSILNKLFET